MAALDTNRHSAIGLDIARGVMKIVVAFSDWNDSRRTRRALSALSDHELDDIGLNRGDIDLVATRKIY